MLIHPIILFQYHCVVHVPATDRHMGLQFSRKRMRQCPPGTDVHTVAGVIFTDGFAAKQGRGKESGANAVYIGLGNLPQADQRKMSNILMLTLATGVNRLNMFEKLAPMFKELQRGVWMDLGAEIGQKFVCFTVVGWLADLPERAVQCSNLQSQALQPCVACSVLHADFCDEHLADLVGQNRTQEAVTKQLAEIASLATESAK
jgi:hypothetical protein